MITRKWCVVVRRLQSGHTVCSNPSVDMFYDYNGHCAGFLCLNFLINQMGTILFQMVVVRSE
jgi:hypothetical protein